MSYTVTGIQSVLASFSFPGTEHASGAANSPQPTKPSTDQGDTVNLSAPDTVSLSSANKTQVQSLAGTPATSAVTGVASTASSAAVQDTVTLSTADKVRNLRQEGEGDNQIATTLNLSIKEVDDDLHLNTHVPQSFTVAPVLSSLSVNTPAAASA